MVPAIVAPGRAAVYHRGPMMDVVLSILMLAALALLAGGFLLWRKTGNLKQPLLMALLAIIAVANVAIWTIPAADGSSPLDQVETSGANQ